MAASVSQWINDLEAIKNAFMKIQLIDHRSLAYQRLYRLVFNITRAGKCLELRDALTKLIDDHAKEIRTNIIDNLKNERLHDVVIIWERYLLATNMFKQVLMLYDEYCAAINNFETSYQLKINAFINEVIHYTQVHNMLQEVLVKLIRTDMDGGIIDITNFKAIINMLLTLSKDEYEEIFEKPFIANAEIFYKNEAQKAISSPTINAVEYISNYERLCNEAKERVKRLLHESTEAKILSIIDKYLLDEQLNRVIEMRNGLKLMIETEKYSQLTILYKCYKKSKKETDFFELVSKIFTEIALKIVERENIKPKDYPGIIDEIIKLENKFKNYQANCFENNEEFETRLESSLIEIINKNQQMVEYLSSNMNETLKNKYELSEAEQDEKIEKFMKFFKLLDDKDVFIRYYKKYLAKRLVVTNPNLDIERKVITLFKQECGLTYTNEFEQMIKDIELSTNHMNVFRENCDGLLSHIDFRCYVLQSHIWRMQEEISFNLTAAPNTAFELFKKFYLNIYKDRKLTIDPSLGRAVIEMSPISENTKTEFIEVSTIQMIILLLFNKKEKFTIQEILDESQIPENDVITALNPIVTGKPTYRILQRVGEFPHKTPLSVTDIIEINNTFSTKSSRPTKLPVNTIQIEGNTELRAQIIKRVNNRRCCETECAIVRSMKKFRVAKEHDLMIEVINQLKNRFKPDVKAIKKCICCLIDRKYMKPSEDDSKTYIYVEEDDD